MKRLHKSLEIAVAVVVPVAGAALMAALSSVAGKALAPVVLLCGLCGVAAVIVEAQRRKHRMALFIVVMSAATLGAVSWYAEPRPLTSMTRERLQEALAADARLLSSYEKGMAAVVQRLDKLGLPPPGDTALTADQERALLQSWRSLLSYALAVESLRVFYEDYYRIDLDARRDDHVMAFLLTFAADAALYEHSSAFTERVGENGNAQKYLDTPHAGLPRASFSHFREEMIGLRDGARIRAGEQYLRVVAAMMPKLPLASDLKQRIEGHIGAIDDIGLPAVELTTRAELQRFKRVLSSTWYPIQKKAAEVLGDTRVRRVGEYLIGDALCGWADERLAPGDILLARKNWYLSNVGLPGFWPHAIIYLGPPDQLPNARALADKYPEAWAHYSSGDKPRRVIEAISEGVTFSTLKECAGDYLVGLRPRLPKDEIAAAIDRAFSHYGKPYDFDFDFATEHALVCTELVYRAYRPIGGAPGIELTLAEMAGRTTLPANDIAAQYAREHGTPDAQLDFVLFIDAREKEGQAFVSTEPSFRATHERTQWDISQE